MQESRMATELELMQLRKRKRAMTGKERHDLRLTIWFDLLTKKQRKMVSNKGYFYLSLEDMNWEDIIKVTRSARTLKAFRDLKRSIMRVA